MRELRASLAPAFPLQLNRGSVHPAPFQTPTVPLYRCGLHCDAQDGTPKLRLILLFCLRLRPLDIEFMKRLSKVVNIVPVIAKADTLTLEERVYFKQRVGCTAAAQPLSLEDCLDTL